MSIFVIMKEKIIELRKKGYTLNRIAEELNCAKSTVSYHINKVNLGGNKNNFLFGVSDETINEIKNLRLSGKTYDEITKLINISKDKLTKICKRIELNFNIKNLRASKLNSEEVIKYYLEIKSKRKTAIFFNVSKEKIMKIVGDVSIKKISGSEAVINWRKKKKIELVKYKGGCCERCGYNKSFEVLQFHHINPNEKDFSISGKSYSINRLKKEVDKCILVCANCHIEIHEELKQK